MQRVQGARCKVDHMYLLTSIWNFKGSSFIVCGPNDVGGLHLEIVQCAVLQLCKFNRVTVSYTHLTLPTNREV